MLEPQKFTKTKRYFELKGKNAEKVVHELAEKTFLIDWCFPNVMLQNGKELCDLLVVFDSVAIIWQIKDLKLTDGKYNKSEVNKNLRQLSGARRQMFNLKSNIELSNARRQKEIFNPDAISEVFLISVLLGEGEDYFSALEDVNGHDVHVFTKEFTEIVLDELDTISDFCDYLRAKEDFFKGNDKKIIVNGGEQEMLAIYLREGRTFGEYKKADNIFLDGSLWERLMSEPRFLKKKEADKISYGWDSIINRAHTSSTKYEPVARELARPNRFERRYLSKVFMDAHVVSHESEEGDLFRRILPTDGVTYCFLFMDDFSEKREKRQSMLGAICYFARGKFPKNTKVIGIATEKKLRPINSYDFVYLNKPTWTGDDQKYMDLLQKEVGMFAKPLISEAHEDEYPE